MDAKKSKKIVVLATGGTIAGIAADASNPQNYRAGQLSGADLLTELSADVSSVEVEDIAHVDSKDMNFDIWRNLLLRVSECLQDERVQGVVITHGTDTLEETAYFLQTVLNPEKPVAFTCAMLPANAPDSDGPKNLKDAIEWAMEPKSQGVSVVCAGAIHPAISVQKVNSQMLNPFHSMASPDLPKALSVPSVKEFLAVKKWPRVEVVMNHVGSDGFLVKQLLNDQPPAGWVVAGTGNGTMSQALEDALVQAQRQGAQVLRASRCAWGGVQTRNTDRFAHAEGLTLPQARVALFLHLIHTQAGLAESA